MTSTGPIRNGPSIGFGAISGRHNRGCLAAGEGIGEALADALEDGCVGPGCDRRHDQVVDRAQIVDAVDVVGVGVGVEQGVDLADAGIQALLA